MTLPKKMHLHQNLSSKDRTRGAQGKKMTQELHHLGSASRAPSGRVTAVHFPTEKMPRAADIYGLLFLNSCFPFFQMNRSFISYLGTWLPRIKTAWQLGEFM